jgi:hypothetical protein
VTVSIVCGSDGDTAIDGIDALLVRSPPRKRDTAARVEKDPCANTRLLSLRPIEFHLVSDVERIAAHITDDADDLHGTLPLVTSRLLPIGFSSPKTLAAPCSSNSRPVKTGMFHV